MGKLVNNANWKLWYGYEVLGMILLRDLKGAMRLDRSKDMSVRVSTCNSYDFNALTSASCVDVVALMRRVCFYVSLQNEWSVFLSKIITADEKWCLQYNPERKR